MRLKNKCLHKLKELFYSILILGKRDKLQVE